MTSQFDLSDSDQRRKAWNHAAVVLSVPEFMQVRFMVQNCGIIDLMISAREAQLQPLRLGRVPAEWLEVEALSDYWILGFFELLRIICKSKGPFHRYADFQVGPELLDLQKRAAMVRSAFAKLQLIGKNTAIFPSHALLHDSVRTVFAVEDEHGQDVFIDRQGLADEFLRILERLPQSPRFLAFLASISRKGSSGNENEAPAATQSENPASGNV